MRQAFVLTLDDSSDPGQRRFAGWIEDVDTARELRFQSTDQLLAFLAESLEHRRAAGSGTGDREE